MEYYASAPQPTLHPSYSATYHHSAAAHPPLYQTSAYSVPTIHNPQTMPTYYVSGSPSQHRSRSHSQSGHQQPIVYSSSGGSRQYLSAHDYAHEPSRRRRSSSVGHGGHYYYPSGGHSSSHRSSSRSPTYYVSSSPSHRRSHSHTRHHSTSQRDAGHHRSGSRRPSVSYSDSGYHHSSHHQRRNSDSLGDRFRRWFGGFGQHGRGTEYVDARTGQPVDRDGRPIYRV